MDFSQMPVFEIYLNDKDFPQMRLLLFFVCFFFGPCDCSLQDFAQHKKQN